MDLSSFLFRSPGVGTDAFFRFPDRLKSLYFGKQPANHLENEKRNALDIFLGEFTPPCAGYSAHPLEKWVCRGPETRE
jgi:hypothetical protein